MARNLNCDNVLYLLYLFLMAITFCRSFQPSVKSNVADDLCLQQSKEAGNRVDIHVGFLL
ncbi:hypothetical protein BC832DRAFT_548713 [Gaertneriomyces semiglobifer]|nr:hypothetical protein BC832DRAFT_548713 [Gaertneriomyces semiglobifer]